MIQDYIYYRQYGKCVFEYLESNIPNPDKLMVFRNDKGNLGSLLTFSEPLPGDLLINYTLIIQYVKLGDKKTFSLRARPIDPEFVFWENIFDVAKILHIKNTIFS